MQDYLLVSVENVRSYGFAIAIERRNRVGRRRKKKKKVGEERRGTYAGKEGEIKETREHQCQLSNQGRRSFNRNDDLLLPQGVQSASDNSFSSVIFKVTWWPTLHINIYIRCTLTNLAPNVAAAFIHTYISSRVFILGDNIATPPRLSRSNHQSAYIHLIFFCPLPRCELVLFRDMQLCLTYLTHQKKTSPGAVAGRHGASVIRFVRCTFKFTSCNSSSVHYVSEYL